MERIRTYQKCINYIGSNKVRHPDQDALNAILFDKKMILDSRWNYISNYHTRYISKEEYEEDLFKTKTYFPIFIHFKEQNRGQTYVILHSKRMVLISK